MMNANYHAFSRGQGTRPEYNELADLEDRLHQWTAFYHLPAPLRKALGRCLHKINEGTDYNGLFALTLETFPLGTERAHVAPTEKAACLSLILQGSLPWWTHPSSFLIHQVTSP